MKRFLFSLFVLAVSASPVFAGPILDFVGADGQTVWVNERGNIKNVTAGVYNHDTNGDSVADLMSFCVDLKQIVPDGQEYEVVALKDVPKPEDLADHYPMGPAKAGDLKKMWATHINDALQSDFNKAAFQLAIWEVAIEDTGASYDVSQDSGDFFMYFDTGLRDKANSYLTGWGTDEAGLLGLAHDEKQCYVTAIPAPGAILLGSIGIGLVGYLRRKRTF